MVLGPGISTLSPFLNGLSAGAGYCGRRILDDRDNETVFFLPELTMSESFFNINIKILKYLKYSFFNINYLNCLVLSL